MTGRTAPYPLLSRGFIAAYWVTLRPYLLFVSGAAGLVGLALPADIESSAFAAAFVAFFLCYGLGQALTDAFQTDTDALSSPYRPLIRGQISRAQVLRVSLGGLALCALVFACCNLWTVVPSVLGVLGLASYSAMKRRWWAGPLWNSWIVALLPLIGLLCGGAPLARALDHPLLPRVMVSVGLSYATFVLLGYLKDVEADRATGYETLPVRFGRRATCAASALCLAPALGCAPGLLVGRPAGAAAWAGLTLWAAGALLLLAAHLRALRVKRDDQAHPAIALGVRGFVALQLGQAVVLRPGLWALALLLALAFEQTLRRRPCREQI